MSFLIPRGINVVSEGTGSIFRRKDGKYFLYLPKDMVENTGFPFSSSSVRVEVCFTRQENYSRLSEV
jgi:hypothetical protein